MIEDSLEVALTFLQGRFCRTPSGDVNAGMHDLYDVASVVTYGYIAGIDHNIGGFPHSDPDILANRFPVCDSLKNIADLLLNERGIVHPIGVGQVLPNDVFSL